MRTVRYIHFKRVFLRIEDSVNEEKPRCREKVYMEDAQCMALLLFFDDIIHTMLLLLLLEMWRTNCKPYACDMLSKYQSNMLHKYIHIICTHPHQSVAPNIALMCASSEHCARDMVFVERTNNTTHYITIPIYIYRTNSTAKNGKCMAKNTETTDPSV